MLTLSLDAARLAAALDTVRLRRRHRSRARRRCTASCSTPTPRPCTWSPPTATASPPPHSPGPPRTAAAVPAGRAGGVAGGGSWTRCCGCWPAATGDAYRHQHGRRAVEVTAGRRSVRAGAAPDDYPDWRRLEPAPARHRVPLDGPAFRAALAGRAGAAQGPGRDSLRRRRPHARPRTATLAVGGDGDLLRVGVNRDFLLDALGRPRPARARARRPDHPARDPHSRPPRLVPPHARRPVHPLTDPGASAGQAPTGPNTCRPHGLVPSPTRARPGPEAPRQGRPDRTYRLALTRARPVQTAESPAAAYRVPPSAGRARVVGRGGGRRGSGAGRRVDRARGRGRIGRGCVGSVGVGGGVPLGVVITTGGGTAAGGQPASPWAGTAGRGPRPWTRARSSTR